jgi:L-lactate dehydrogenase complex protein LldF
MSGTAGAEGTFLGMPAPAAPAHAPRGIGRLRADPPFPKAARVALADTQLRRNIGHATATIRAKRAAVVAEVADWEELRLAGQQIKAATMARLDEHLERLEREVISRGGSVHWARDAIEAGDIVTRLVRATGESEVVKVKSMVTAEIGLNDTLAEAGITALETDLAELIVQLGDDLPSHILVPAIHRNRTEIRDLFVRAMPGAPSDLSDGRPRSSAPQVPDREGGDQRREFRRRRDRHPAGGRVRGQRPDVPDNAADPDHGDGDREGGALLARPRGLPAAAAAVLHR